MRHDKGIPAVALLAGVIAGCGGPGNLNALRARAAFDFQCDQDKIQLNQLANGYAPAQGVGAVYGVTGCGRRGTYVRPPGTGEDTWVLNSGGVGAEEAMGRPPPVVAPLLPVPPPPR